MGMSIGMGFLVVYLYKQLCPSLLKCTMLFRVTPPASVFGEERVRFNHLTLYPIQEEINIPSKYLGLSSK